MHMFMTGFPAVRKPTCGLFSLQSSLGQGYHVETEEDIKKMGGPGHRESMWTPEPAGSATQSEERMVVPTKTRIPS